MEQDSKHPGGEGERAHRLLEAVFSGLGGSVLNVAAGRVLVAQGQELQKVYRVDRGFVRLCIYSEDGIRRIVGFCGPGAVIGVGQMNHRHWAVSVEAVTHCVVTSLPKKLLARKIESDRGVREGALNALQFDIALREAHLVMMGVLPSTERVYAFLQAFSKMRGRDGFLALPMCRRDIGDYLGLSMETVSRSFTALREAGRIELNGAEKFRILPQADAALSDRAA